MLLAVGSEWGKDSFSQSVRVSSMSVTSKSTSLQSYHMVLYQNAIHPEFFGIEGRKRIAYSGYDYEGWIFGGGHSLRFEYGDVCLVEVVTELPEKLPEKGLITTLQCAGERDHDAEFEDQVIYMTSMQTETLSDHLFLSTYNELREHAIDGDCLMSEWTDESGKPNLSVVDVQRYNREVHVQGYHMRSDCGLVLRTQSIFQVKKD
jgi:hypothetical protein